MHKNKLNLHICGIHLLNPYKTVVSHLNVKNTLRPGKTHFLIVNVIVTQHHRRPSMQISCKPVVSGYIVAGFGSFWLVSLVLLVVLGGFVGGFGWFWVVLAGSVF